MVAGAWDDEETPELEPLTAMESEPIYQGDQRPGLRIGILAAVAILGVVLWSSVNGNGGNSAASMDQADIVQAGWADLFNKLDESNDGGDNSFGSFADVVDAVKEQMDEQGGDDKEAIANAEGKLEEMGGVFDAVTANLSSVTDLSNLSDGDKQAISVMGSIYDAVSNMSDNPEEVQKIISALNATPATVGDSTDGIQGAGTAFGEVYGALEEAGVPVNADGLGGSNGEEAGKAIGDLLGEMSDSDMDTVSKAAEKFKGFWR